EAPDIVVERVNKDRERKLPLEFRRRSPQNQVAARVGAVGQFAEQARLPDSRLADELDRSRLAAVESLEREFHGCELLRASDERIALPWSRNDAVRHRTSFVRTRM